MEILQVFIQASHLGLAQRIFTSIDTLSLGISDCVLYFVSAVVCLILLDVLNKQSPRHLCFGQLKKNF